MIPSNLAVDIALLALGLCLYAYARAWDDERNARQRHAEFWKWMARRLP